MLCEIVLFIVVSLDGYIVKENDDLEWLMEMEGEGDNGYIEMYEMIDIIIMGKKMYDYVVEYMEIFLYLDKVCYVFFCLEKGLDGNVEFVNEDVVEFIKRLKV